MTSLTINLGSLRVHIRKHPVCTHASARARARAHTHTYSLLRPDQPYCDVRWNYARKIEMVVDRGVCLYSIVTVTTTPFSPLFLSASLHIFAKALLFSSESYWRDTRTLSVMPCYHLYQQNFTNRFFFSTSSLWYSPHLWEQPSTSAAFALYASTLIASPEQTKLSTCIIVFYVTPTQRSQTQACNAKDAYVSRERTGCLW